MRLGPKLRNRFSYSIPVAGAQVGWSPSEACRAAARGDIPYEVEGRLHRVPRELWDQKVKKVLRGQHIKRRRIRKAAAAEASARWIAEQLVSSNALRQRRYRERQALRDRNGQALQPPDSDDDGGAP
jgi:hypothetical protein